MQGIEIEPITLININKYGHKLSINIVAIVISASKFNLRVLHFFVEYKY